ALTPPSYPRGTSFRERFVRWVAGVSPRYVLIVRSDVPNAGLSLEKAKAHREDRRRWEETAMSQSNVQECGLIINK
ncbi:MAG TPA: hypothetical protein VN812_02730, partial [Candidatus Acidoferrales bacterium]|nr:hypothetical protein [Candidatus Acidoferrales bacterium]